MTRLHYVGFNGYGQFPHSKKNNPKVITKWTSTAADGIVNACTHRFVVVESAECVTAIGVVTDTSEENLILKKPEEIDNFGSCDEFMIASRGVDVWKFSYKNSKWVKLDLKFLNEGEKSVWGEIGNKISKFSFLLNLDVVLLLSNGSVWLLAEDSLKLKFPYDIDKAVDISSGLEHSLILTESGCVLAFGNGSRGQLGHGDLNPAKQPVQIVALEGLKAVKIAAGGWHSCAVTDSGDLYAWGWNNFGQLSAFEDGEDIGLTALPVIVEVGEELEVKVVDVACGMRHTIVCLDNGDLYGAGWNAYNQLGVGCASEKISKFTKCQFQFPKEKSGGILCGPWYTILVEEQ